MSDQQPLDLLAPERLERLKAAGASQSELAVAQRLRSQVIQAIRLAEEESSIKVRDNMEDAIARYRDRLEALELKYLAPPDEGGAGEYFANRREAWQWLRENGLEMGESTFYRRIGEPGFPRLLPDKRLSRWECGEFLRRQMVDGGATPTGGVYNADELVQRKLVADTEKAEADAGIARSKRLRLERETDREWIPRKDAFALAAALVGRLRDAVLHHLRHRALSLTQAVRGETERAPELYEAAAAAVATAFNEVSAQGLDVTLADDPDESPDDAAAPAATPKDDEDEEDGEDGEDGHI